MRKTTADRLASEPATPRQLAAIDRLGFECEHHPTKRQAQNLILYACQYWRKWRRRKLLQE